MRFLPEYHADRREFFRAAARYSFLGVLAAFAALSGRSVGLRTRCVSRGICGGCRAFVDCELPPALTVKAARARTTGKPPGLEGRRDTRT